MYKKVSFLIFVNSICKLTYMKNAFLIHFNLKINIQLNFNYQFSNLIPI